MFGHQITVHVAYVDFIETKNCRTYENLAMDRRDNKVQGLPFTLQQQNMDRIFNTPRTIIKFLTIFCGRFV